MDLELAGKVAVVTGASKGIGLAITRALAAEGTAVVAGARSIDSLLDMDRVSAFEVDLVEPGGSEELVGHAVDRHGRVDVLVNNVGGVRLRRRAPASYFDWKRPAAAPGASGVSRVGSPSAAVPRARPGRSR